MKTKKGILRIAVIFAAIITIAIALAIHESMRPESPGPPVEGEQRTSAVFREILLYEKMMRVYWVHIPYSYDGSHKVPLVLGLHGAGGNGYNFEIGSGWLDLSEENDFILVCPSGSISVPPSGLAWNTYDWVDSPDDVGFLMALINQLKKDYLIDPGRVYMTGYSNGASMTNTFAFKYANVLAAIAPVSGRWMTTLGIDPYNISQPNAPLPVYIWRGGEEREPEHDQLQKQYWIDWNKVNKTPTNVLEGIYKTEIYSGGNAEVRFTEIIGRGHDTYDPNTSAKIWYDFFQRFSRIALSTPYDPWPADYLLTGTIKDPELNLDVFAIKK